MRFVKKLISIILIFVLVILEIPSFQVSAADDQEFVLVNTQLSEDGEIFVLTMLKEGNDLFINVNDVPRIVPYEMIGSPSQKKIVSYKRGYKIVNFSLIDNRVYFPNQDFSSNYYGAKHVDGEVYLSLSSALPWLDANAMNNNGNLLVSSEPIIFWEIYEEFLSLPSTDFGAHLEDDYVAAGNNIMMTIFWDNLFSLINIDTTVKKLVPAGPGYSYYTKETYMDCLFSMGISNPLENDVVDNILSGATVLNNIGKIAKQAGVDLSTLEVSDEFARGMIEYGIDASTQNLVYEGVEGISETYKVLKGLKYVKLFAEWVNCTAIAVNTPHEYISALSSLQNYTHQNKNGCQLLIWDAANATIKDFAKESKKIVGKTVEFGFGEALGLVFEPTMTSVVAKFSVGLGKILFYEQFDAIDKVSKIPIYAEIEYLARDMIQDYKNLDPSTNPTNKMLHGVMIASLSSKKSLQAFKAWDKVKDIDFTQIDEQINKCNEIYAKAIICTTGLEYQMAFDKSTDPNMQDMKRWQEAEYYNRMSFSSLQYNQDGGERIDSYDDESNDISSDLNEIIGTWYTSTNGQYCEITFNADKTGCLFEQKDSQNFQWKIAGDTISLTTTPLREMTYWIENDFLYMSYDNEIFMYTRKLIVEQPEEDGNISQDENDGQTNNDGSNSIPNKYESEDNFSFSDGTITGYNGKNAYVNIPPTINGQPVLKISGSSLEGHKGFRKNTYVECVVVPEGVTVIDSDTFEKCSNLERVILPSTLTEIGACAFLSCDSLKEINLPNTLKILHIKAFAGCTSLTSVTFPDGMKEIGAYSFLGCANLKTIYVPKSIDVLGIYAFDGCRSLSDIYYYGTPEEYQSSPFAKTGYNDNLASCVIYYKGGN